MSRSTNRRASLTEPEIWFKIVHVTPELRDLRPEARDHNQTVEIALGPKGTFEHGHIGTLTRQVPADRVVSAVPPGRGKPKRPQEPKTPRVAELLRKALEWRALLKSGEVATQAAIARREGIKRWTPKFGQVAKVGSRPRRRSLACHGRDGVIRLS